MTKDSAKSRRGGKRGAARSHERTGAPPWLWLVTGAATGLFASFLFHLATTPGDRRPAAPRSAQHPAGVSTTGKGSKPEPKFDFYTLLPDTEVIVPDEAPGKKQAVARPNTIYYLQAGSFRQAKPADRRRAELLLLGLDASVDKVNTRGETWYRVQAGPFASHGKLSTARSKLIGEGIDTLVLSKRNSG